MVVIYSSCPCSHVYINLSLRIDVIWNSENVGFSQIIPRYKQTFTVITSRCTTVHNVTNMFDKLVQFLEVFTVKVCLYLRISWENQKYSQFRSISVASPCDIRIINKSYGICIKRIKYKIFLEKHDVKTSSL